MKETVVRIEKLAFGGAGFGRVEGKACFVPFTAPGDTARIKVTVQKRSYLEGEVLELLEPSARRVDPECPIFGRCGGCNWQHLSYSDQLVAKEEIFADLLWRSGRVGRERVLPIVPAPEPYGYRSRIQLKLRRIGGELHLGFYRAASHFVVDLPDECAIAHPSINRVIGKLRSVVSFFPEADKIPQIDVAVGGDGQVEVIFHYIGSRSEEIGRQLQQAHHLLGAARIFLQTGRKITLEKISGSDATALAYTIPNRSLPNLPDTRLEFCSGGFSQVNYRQNLTLVEMACSWAALTGNERVLDIYCGNGNFSIPLARHASGVFGVEDYAPSIDSARANSTAAGVENITFECSDAITAIDRLVSSDAQFDVVLLDPPRSGAAEVVRRIPAFKPRSILYVSCDPSTLARDIGILRKLDYEVVKSSPMDMFPQTYHIESLTLLEPAGKSGLI